MNYTAPANVIGPQDYVSNVHVIYDGGQDSVSIARLDWEGNQVFAMRWNVARREWDDPDKASGSKVCLGMPSSRGYPVWFVLPDEMLNPDSEIWQHIRTATNA
jgi:hypothetical protein